MSIPTHTSPTLGHDAHRAGFVPGATPAAGPFPGMSPRAALITRALTFALVVAWAAAIEPQLLLLLAFALAFWIGAELDLVNARRAASAAPARLASLLPFRRAERDSVPRPSHPAPRAA